MVSPGLIWSLWQSPIYSISCNAIRTDPETDSVRAFSNESVALKCRDDATTKGFRRMRKLCSQRSRVSVRKAYWTIMNRYKFQDQLSAMNLALWVFWSWQLRDQHVAIGITLLIDMNQWHWDAIFSLRAPTGLMPAACRAAQQNE